MAKQMRVHILAKELGVTSKTVLEKCRAEGLELKNHMATLSAGLEATVREWFSEGSHQTVEEKAARVDLKKARKKATRKRTTKKVTKKKAPTKTEVAATAVAEAPEVPAAAELEAGAAAAIGTETAPAVAVEAPAEPTTPEGAPTVETPAEPPAAAALVEPPEAPPEKEPASLPAAEAPVKEAPEAGPEKAAEEELVRPAGPQLTKPRPAQLQGPQVVRVDAPEPARRHPRRAGGRPGAPRPAGRGEPLPTEPFAERLPVTDKRGRGRGGPVAREEGGPSVGGKTRVHPRRSKESVEAEELIREFRDRDLIEREERLKAAGERGGLRRRAAEVKARDPLVVRPKVDKVEMGEPIILKDLCGAIGIGFNRVFPKLMAMGKMTRIMDTIDRESATRIAEEFGIELTVREARTLLEDLEEEFRSTERKRQERRPPVVTFLGHVDHGKTSLLDAIRKSRLLDREAGGITQQIGAYRFCEGGADVTFIDTPGHEAFTSMRSRGATMTDVVVLVVAADDGIMPTTREAIQHAREADVPMVVALNKIDLPGVDVNRVYGQLAEENLTPADWGGQTDVIKTSAITGEGLGDLLEHLTTLTELLELRCDPTAPATGWVVEAEEKRGEGIVATLLVRDGSLSPGTMIVCGPAHGRIRAMRDDFGRPVKTATPGTPVEISGLDVVPAAGDRFYQVDDLKRAKQITQEQQDRLREALLTEASKPTTLEELFKERDADELPELNVILRADTRGKLETLKAELGRLSDEQVRLRIVLDGIGAITESDVALASTSQAVIIGYWVVPEDAARRMAQDLGVDIRLYRVIYEVTDEIRQALEGLLEPERKEEYQGRLEVRQVFHIGRVGKVAGCYVADGVVARNHQVRVIRDGAVVRDECAIASLRRVKDDVREVRAGFECGLKIEGFDDVHVGDIIEAYEVVEIARTLA